MHEKAASGVLKQWLQKRKSNPYPTPQEKSMLMEKTGLNRSQLDHWFTNARQRYVRPKSRRGPNPNYSRYPHSVTKVLVEWLTNPVNMNHPYPSVEDQAELMKKTKLSKRQLQNWFTNARKRRLATRVLKQKVTPDAVGKDTLQGGSAGTVLGKRSLEAGLMGQNAPKKKFNGPALNTVDLGGSPLMSNPLVNLQSVPVPLHVRHLLIQAQLSGYGNLIAAALSAQYGVPSPSNIENRPFNQIPVVTVDSTPKFVTSPRDVQEIGTLQASKDREAASMILNLQGQEKC